MRLTSLACAAALMGAPAFAGVPASQEAVSGKWQQVSKSWLIDTEDVEIKGDQLRFWVERVAVGIDTASTQYTTAWTGKIRVRCGDFHRKLFYEAQNSLGMKFYINTDGWIKIKPNEFAYVLASNFCYITKAPGYTPEPIQHEWQEKITAALKAAPVKPLRKSRKDDCDDGPRCR